MIHIEVGYLHHAQVLTVLNIYWITLVLLTIVVSLNDKLSFVADHGKTAATADNRPSRTAAESIHIVDTLDWLQDLLKRSVVPKHYFSHFYYLGIFVTMLCIVLHVSLTLYSGQPSDQCSLPLLLFLLQVVRRAWECNFITEYGSSKMSMVGYAAGMLHYIMTPVTLLLVGLDANPRIFVLLDGCCTLMNKGDSSVPVNDATPLSHSSAFHDLARDSTLIRVVSVLVYATASFFQYQCHYVLFRLKRDSQLHTTDHNYNSSTAKYALPYGSLFNYVACPHYFTEICVYFSLWLFHPDSPTMLLLLLWVVANLSVVAYRQFTWYVEHYFDEFESGKKRHWRVLVPFVW